MNVGSVSPQLVQLQAAISVQKQAMDMEAALVSKLMESTATVQAQSVSSNNRIGSLVNVKA